MTIRASVAGPIVPPLVAPLGGSALPWESGGGGVPWTPAALGSKLKLWLDQRDQVVTGAGVSDWGDQSPTGTQDWAQTIDANRPATGRTINSYAAPDFDGTSDSMTGPAKSAMISAAAYWIAGVVVLDAVASTSSSYHLDESIISDTGQYIWNSFRNNVGVYTMAAGHSDGTAKTTPTQSITLGTPFLFEHWYDGTNINLRVGSAAATQIAAGSVGSLVATTRLGADNDASNLINGAIGALLICNATLTAVEQAAARSYLAAKYGVVG